MTHTCADFKPENQVRCLFNAEVALILEHKMATAKETGQAPKRHAAFYLPCNNVCRQLYVSPRSDFLKAFDYVNRVKQFRDREAVTRARGCAGLRL